MFSALVGATAAPAGATGIVTDAVTGFAVGGYDPVAYFADGRPRRGEAAHEADWGGATWRFVNEGNLGAFLETPDIYAPQFGGHCVVAMARGFAAEGDPQLWTIYKSRLYFFYSDENRRMFNIDPDGFLTEASGHWKTLFPY